MAKTNHFIAKVEDSINGYDLIGEVYTDANTPKQAEKAFKKDPFIKRHLGNKRYKISFRQNAILIQDSE